MQVGDDKSFDDINVTPMVDLYLVLLLIFIIMTTAGVQGVKVKLPKASAKLAALKKETPIIIRGDGATQFQSIMEALDVVNRLNFTEPVGIVAAPPK